MARQFILIDGNAQTFCDLLSQCFKRLKFDLVYRQSDYYVFGQGNNAFGQPYESDKFMVWFRFSDLIGLENHDEFVAFLARENIPYIIIE